MVNLSSIYSSLAQGGGYILPDSNQNVSGYGVPIGPSRPGFVQGTADTIPNSPQGAAQKSSQPSVLGASTSNTGSGDSLFAQLAKSNRNPVQEADYQRMLQEQAASQVNDLYQPQMDYLNQLSGQLDQSKNSEIGTVNDRYNTYMNQLPGEQAQGESAIKTNEQKINDQLRSAYDQALQSYNALRQQRGALYGEGSSAGQAVGELAQRAYFNAQGQIGQQGTQAQQQLSQQRQQLNTYISQKSDALRLQKEDALGQINQYFQQQLSNINANRAATESQKTRDKLSLLQQTIASSQAIQQANTQYQQQIVDQANQQFGQVGSQSYTPDTVGVTLPGAGSTINTGSLQGGNVLGTSTGSSGGQDPLSAFLQSLNGGNIGIGRVGV